MYFWYFHVVSTEHWDSLYTEIKALRKIRVSIGYVSDTAEITPSISSSQWEGETLDVKRFHPTDLRESCWPTAGFLCQCPRGRKQFLKAFLKSILQDSTLMLCLSCPYSVIQLLHTRSTVYAFLPISYYFGKRKFK